MEVALACNAWCLHAVQTRAVIIRTMSEPVRGVALESWQDVVAGAAVSLYSQHVPSSTLISEKSQWYLGASPNKGNVKMETNW